jgi:hypothetical protein
MDFAAAAAGTGFTAAADDAFNDLAVAVRDKRPRIVLGSTARNAMRSFVIAIRYNIRY